MERTNHYLIEDSHDKVFASLLLLTDGSDSGSFLPKEFTSTGSHTAPAPTSVRTPAASPPSHTPQPPQTSPSRSTTSPSLPPNRPAANAGGGNASSGGTSAGLRVLAISVTKGPHGIGLDLVKSSAGKAAVQRLKEMPPGVVNPASQSRPPFRTGDIIVGVNGQPCGTFAETIKMIRALEGVITLQIERQGE